jgi:hypothetical protein
MSYMLQLRNVLWGISTACPELWTLTLHESKSSYWHAHLGIFVSTNWCSVLIDSFIYYNGMILHLVADQRSGLQIWKIGAHILTLWGLNFFTPCVSTRPPLWSSGQSFSLQIQRSGFDSRHYQIFWEIVGPERGLLSLVSTIEELRGRESSSSSLETENTAIGICHADHMAPSIHKSWQWLRRQAVVAWLV